ncbi:MAG: NUDIX domain-containing protein [Bacteroidetes bacterium]|nr:NUDIX domain-containing protein [Bacteroidota bacterium]
MKQNYKVFVDNNVLIFTSNKLEDVPLFDYSDSIVNYEQLISSLSNQNCQIVCENPKKTMKKFFKAFTPIKAAGGLVKYQNKVLWIFRNEKWDLPKGKIERKEKKTNAALREVKEETGLPGIFSIEHKVSVTYHAYFAHEKSVLKKTTWYKMSYHGDLKGKPQKEEGILQVKWFLLDKLEVPLSVTYPSIRDVLMSE